MANSSLDENEDSSQCGVCETDPTDPSALRAAPGASLTALSNIMAEHANDCQRVLEWCCWLLTGSKEPVPATSSNAPGVCGMVWKTGDTVYHCRTCGMDPSCAICHECFADSDHIGHDYWMFSSGGGCCDCGDVEAWKSSGFCSRPSTVSWFLL